MYESLHQNQSRYNSAFLSPCWSQASAWPKNKSFLFPKANKLFTKLPETWVYRQQYQHQPPWGKWYPAELQRRGSCNGSPWWPHSNQRRRQRRWYIRQWQGRLGLRRIDLPGSQDTDCRLPAQLLLPQWETDLRAGNISQFVTVLKQKYYWLWRAGWRGRGCTWYISCWSPWCRRYEATVARLVWCIMVTHLWPLIHRHLYHARPAYLHIQMG